MTNAPTSDDRLHHVVVVGAGFGGLETVHRLAGAPVRITMIDRRNHHLFQPLLYQVATAALATSEIAWPIRQSPECRPELAVDSHPRSAELAAHHPRQHRGPIGRVGQGPGGPTMIRWMHG